MAIRFISILFLFFCACAPAQLARKEQERPVALSVIQSPAQPSKNTESAASSSTTVPAVPENRDSLSLAGWSYLKAGQEEEPVEESAAERDLRAENEAGTEKDLHSPERDERAEAVLDLGRSGDKKKIHEIAEFMLKDPDYQVRANAAAALSMINDKASSTYLIEALKDPVDGVRISAARSLGEFSDDISVAALRNSFQAASPELCAQIVQSLCNSEPGRRELLSVLRGGEDSVKIKTLRTFGCGFLIRPVAEEIAADKHTGAELSGAAAAYLDYVGLDDDIEE